MYGFVGSGLYNVRGSQKVKCNRTRAEMCATAPVVSAPTKAVPTSDPFRGKTGE